MTVETEIIVSEAQIYAPTAAITIRHPGLSREKAQQIFKSLRLRTPAVISSYNDNTSERQCWEKTIRAVVGIHCEEGASSILLNYEYQKAEQASWLEVSYKEIREDCEVIAKALAHAISVFIPQTPVV